MGPPRGRAASPSWAPAPAGREALASPSGKGESLRLKQECLLCPCSAERPALVFSWGAAGELHGGRKGGVESKRTTHMLRYIRKGPTQGRTQSCAFTHTFSHGDTWASIHRHTEPHRRAIIHPQIHAPAGCMFPGPPEHGREPWSTPGRGDPASGGSLLRRISRRQGAAVEGVRDGGRGVLHVAASLEGKEAHRRPGSCRRRRGGG